MIPVFFAAFWKSGVLLGAALGVNGLLRKQSADLRRLVLSTAIVALFVGAAALPVLPHWTAAIPLWRHASAGVAGETFVPPAIDDRTAMSASHSRSKAAHAASRGIDFTPWLPALIWFAVAAALLARFAVNLRGLRRLREASEPVTDAGLLADVARYGCRAGLWRNDAIGAPVTWGIARPVILLPAGFEQMPEEDRDAVLCHELAHIQAHDFAMRCLAEIARALLWFQPLAWMVRRQLREEQELACDDCVLAAGGKPSAYAKLLLEWDSRPGMDALIAVGIAHRTCLKRRLYALLDPDLRRDRVMRSGAVGVLLTGMAAALPLATVSFSQTTQAPAASSAAPKPKFDAASVKPCQPGDGPGRGGGGDMGKKGSTPVWVPEGIGGYFHASPGRLDVTCGSILTMVNVAYVEHGDPLLNNSTGPMSEGEAILGVPKWALAARFTIHAETDDPVATGPTTGGRTPATDLLYGRMLQSLLEDRFQLKVHRAISDAPMFALTVAKSGFKLKPVQDGDCVSRQAGEAMKRVGADDKPYCGWVGWPINGPNRTLVAGGITLERLARTLSQLVIDRNVIDRTGMQGLFNIRLEYAPDGNTRPCVGPAEMCAFDATSDIPPAESVFAALEHQLGLKLEPTKGPLEHIVIDRVQQPSEN